MFQQNHELGDERDLTIVNRLGQRLEANLAHL